MGADTDEGAKAATRDWAAMPAGSGGGGATDSCTSISASGSGSGVGPIWCQT